MLQIHKRFRELLIKALETLDPDGSVPLQLSGGVDSATLLAAQLARGVKPVCYTWRLGVLESDDLKVATKMARAHQLDHRIVTIPVGREILVEDVRRIWALVDQRPDLMLKTVFQCAHPYLYMTPVMVRDGYKASMWGHASGHYFGDSKNEQCEYSRSGELWWRDFKRASLDPVEYRKGGSSESSDMVARSFGHEHQYPYLDAALCEHVINLLMSQTNDPFHKALAVKAFPEFWKDRPWYRKQAPYQIVGGLRAYHETLLQSPFNTNGARDVLPVYKRIVGFAA